MTDQDGAKALLERWRHEVHAGLGLDPDGTTYLDVADRIEQARAAYRRRVAEDERIASDEGRHTTAPAVATEFELV